MSTNRPLGFSIFILVLGMFALSYASVPLYRLFCSKTGYGGTTQTALIAPKTILNRTVTVRFNTDIAPGMPWKFMPEQRQVTVHVGEEKLVFFSAENRDSQPITGVATFNVTPDKAGAYFAKVQCFCFNKQTLKPHEKVTMPVSFFIDPSIKNNKNLDDVGDITLSYTFFRAKP